LAERRIKELRDGWLLAMGYGSGAASKTFNLYSTVLVRHRINSGTALPSIVNCIGRGSKLLYLGSSSLSSQLGRPFSTRYPQKEERASRAKIGTVQVTLTTVISPKKYSANDDTYPTAKAT
jgi:hypothetical protein